MAKKTKSTLIKKLNQDAETALFSGQLSGLVALCYINERPMQGLSGLLDWRFHGSFSRYLKEGAFSGEIGEVIYLPVERTDRIFHLILVGGGESSSPGARTGIPERSLAALTRNLRGLKLEKIGISTSDFGQNEEEYYSKKMGGIPLCLTQ